MHKGWYKTLEDDDDNGFSEFGGYMEAKKAKLIKQVEQADTDCKTTIFKGVAIFVNGHTIPSAEELKLLIRQHGGTYHIYQMPSTTHIIASNLPNVKINKLGPLPIVKPIWIEDSIKSNCLLDYKKYLLYTNQNRTQPKIIFPKAVSETCNERMLKPKELSLGKTASDPSFLSEFYGHSRLHLIATLGAQSKQFVNDLRAQGARKFPGLEQLILSGRNERSDLEDDNLPSSFFIGENFDADKSLEVIMHIDMDCFFVSVGLRDNPHLKGKPVAVTHSKTGKGRNNVDRSVEIAMYKNRLSENAEFRLQDIDDNSSLSEIASCSYEARKMGVKNGMFMGQALKLCPDLVAIPYNFEAYKSVSKILYETICEYTLDIEAVSCDEMYVNITSILRRCKLTVPKFASHIRSVIKQRTGCPCSTGFGGNRLQARVATKRAKPDGFYYLKPSDVINYFSDLPVSDLPGIGRATLIKMKNIGLETCKDVQLANLSLLQKEIGLKLGEIIYEQANGIDKKPLQYEHERKSVSAEVNYGIRFQTRDECVEFLRQLSTEVTKRLQEIEMKAKCITLKLMIRAQNAPKETAKYMGHGVCDSISKSTSVQIATDNPDHIFKETKSLLEILCVPFEDLRGIGIQLSKLSKSTIKNSLLKNFLSKTDNRKREKDSLHVQSVNSESTSATKMIVQEKVGEDNNDKIIFKQQREKDIKVIKDTNCFPRTLSNQNLEFLKLSYSSFIDMLSKWLETNEKPLRIDIDMLGEFFKQMVIMRNIERVHMFLKYLQRNIRSKNDSDWKNAYKSICDMVQDGMIVSYNKKLKLPIL